MTAFKYSKTSLYLLGVLLLTACQPSPPNAESSALDNKVTADTPVVITDDSVTMAPEHILTIKSSRYQPSLGLQGLIEPIKQARFIAVHSADIKDVLVSEGQWVEKGAPLLIVRRVNTASTSIDPQVPNTDNVESDDTNNTATDATPKTENKPKAGDTLNSDATLENKSTQIIADSGLNADKDTLNSSKDATAANNTEANNIAENANKRPNNASSEKSNQPSIPQYDLVTINASFSGRVEKLHVKTNQSVAASTPLLEISDETKLHFMSTLPIQAESQLSVGQNVNFTAEKSLDKFTGQISRLVPTSQPKELLVYVNVIDNEDARNKLTPNMQVTGRVNYGQIEVGTIVPKRALHNVNLSELKTPPYIPLRPLAATVWIIGQDQRLTRQPIEVVEYDPSTQQYLIAGVSNDSLICLADLPASAEGKRVIVS